MQNLWCKETELNLIIQYKILDMNKFYPDWTFIAVTLVAFVPYIRYGYIETIKAFSESKEMAYSMNNCIV